MNNSAGFSLVCSREKIDGIAMLNSMLN